MERSLIKGRCGKRTKWSTPKDSTRRKCANCQEVVCLILKTKFTKSWKKESIMHRLASWNGRNLVSSFHITKITKPRSKHVNDNIMYEASKACLSTYCEFKLPASVQAILFWYVEMLHSHCLHPVGHIRNQFHRWRLWKEHYHEPFGKDLRLAFHFRPSILKQGLMKTHWVWTASSTCQCWHSTHIETLERKYIYIHGESLHENVINVPLN